MQANNTLEMPLYKSNKIVGGLKIRAITIVPGGCVMDFNWYLHFEDMRYDPVAVTNDWRIKHNPEAGGYFVKYEGGYTSYHPAKRFESSFTRIETVEDNHGV